MHHADKLCRGTLEQVSSFVYTDCHTPAKTSEFPVANTNFMIEDKQLRDPSMKDSLSLLLLPHKAGHICTLPHALYRLKEAPRALVGKFSST